MKAFIEVAEFLEGVRESTDKIARFYNPKVGTKIGKITVVSHGRTGAIVSAWTKDDKGRPTLNATIAFPAVPFGSKLSRREADIWMGYAIHELGHAFDTDPKGWRIASMVGTAQRNILNGLEDVRMERDCAARLTPNAMRCLSVLNDYALEKAIASGVSFDHLSQLPYALATLGRWREMGMAPEACAKLWAGIRPKRRAWLDTVLKRLSKCKTTEDCARLALAVYAEALRMGAMDTQPTQTADEQDQQQGEEQAKTGDDLGSEVADNSPGLPAPTKADEEDEGQGADGEEGDDEDTGDDKGAGAGAGGEEGEDEGAGAGVGAGAGAGAGGEEGDDESTAPHKSGDEPGKASSTGKGGTGFGLGAEAQLPDKPTPEQDDVNRSISPEPSLAQSANDVSARSISAGNGRHFFGGVTYDDRFYKNGPHKQSRDTWESEYPGMYTRATHGTARMRSMLKQLLVAPENVGKINFERHGKLGSRDIARAGSGDTNVFHKRWVDEGIETAVYIIIDGSGSMAGLIRNASDMALSLSLAVEACRMPVEVAVFHDGGNGSAISGAQTEAENHVPGITGNLYSTSNQGASCKLKIIKPFSVRSEQCKAAFGFMRTMATSGTPDYAAIMGGITRIKKRRENRKIVFMLTDGAGQSDAVRWAACNYAPRHGVTCIGVGIGHDVSQQYPLSMTIPRYGASSDGLGALAAKGMRLLLQQAQRNRGKKVA